MRFVWIGWMTAVWPIGWLVAHAVLAVSAVSLRQFGMHGGHVVPGRTASTRTCRC